MEIIIFMTAIAILLTLLVLNLYTQNLFNRLSRLVKYVTVVDSDPCEYFDLILKSLEECKRPENAIVFCLPVSTTSVKALSTSHFKLTFYLTKYHTWNIFKFKKDMDELEVFANNLHSYLVSKVKEEQWKKK